MEMIVLTRFMELDISKYLFMGTIVLGIFLLVRKIMRG